MYRFPHNITIFKCHHHVTPSAVLLSPIAAFITTGNTVSPLVNTSVSSIVTTLHSCINIYENAKDFKLVQKNKHCCFI